MQPVESSELIDQIILITNLAYAKIKWSHFKPEFTGKPEEDADAHLLRKNYWMDTHAFPEGVKVQHFCQILVGEARWWYESLRPINID